MNKTPKQPPAAHTSWLALSATEKIKTVLHTADAKDKLKLILQDNDSHALTQALSCDNFARLVFDLGAEDATELIEMSSDEQLTHLLDLAGWDAEEFSPARYEAWLPMLLEAGPEKMVDWLQSTDMEVLTLLGRHWFSTYKYVPSQDMQEPPDDLPEFTLDGVYFLEFNNPNLSAVVAQVLVVLKSELPGRYLDLMEAMRWEVESELLEYARRWRQGRLQDQGFPLREEALALWALPRPEEHRWQDLPPKYSSLAAGAGQEGYWRNWLPEDQLLPQSVHGLSRQDLEALTQEMAYIANCGIVGLNADPSDSRLTWQAGREALAMVNLGLSVLSAGDKANAAAMVTRLSLAALARHGASAVRALNNKAWTLMQEGWMKDLPAGLNLLDAPLDHWLAGLLFKLPRYYDEGQKPEYRPFMSVAEINQADHMLDQAAFWGRLMFELLAWNRLDFLALITGPAWPLDPGERKLSQVLGTWLARRALKLSPELAPIPQEHLRAAIAALQEGFKGQWLSQALASGHGLADRQEASLASRLLSETIENLRRQLGHVNLRAELNPAFIGGFIIAS